jgi:hypothetical protein
MAFVKLNLFSSCFRTLNSEGRDEEWKRNFKERDDLGEVDANGKNPYGRPTHA